MRFLKSRKKIGVVWDKDHSVKWLRVRVGGVLRIEPLSYEPQDRKIRLRVLARMARLKHSKLSSESLAELRKLGISTDDLKVVVIDEAS